MSPSTSTIWFLVRGLFATALGLMLDERLSVFLSASNL